MSILLISYSINTHGGSCGYSVCFSSRSSVRKGPLSFYASTDEVGNLRNVLQGTRSLGEPGEDTPESLKHNKGEVN